MVYAMRAVVDFATHYGVHLHSPYLLDYHGPCSESFVNEWSCDQDPTKREIPSTIPEITTFSRSQLSRIEDLGHRLIILMN
jgi:hypothetical protein